MGPIGIDHHAKLFIILDQLVYQLCGALKVHIIIASAVNHQKVPLQLMGKCNGRAFYICLLILAGQTGVPLLIDGVI